MIGRLFFQCQSMLDKEQQAEACKKVGKEICEKASCVSLGCVVRRWFALSLVVDISELYGEGVDADVQITLFFSSCAH